MNSDKIQQLENKYIELQQKQNLLCKKINTYGLEAYSFSNPSDVVIDWYKQDEILAQEMQKIENQIKAEKSKQL